MNETHKEISNVGLQPKNAFPLGWLIIGFIAFIAFFQETPAVKSPRKKSNRSALPFPRWIERWISTRAFCRLKKFQDTETWGEGYKRLSGVFGARVRVGRLKLGDETLELTESLTPRAD